MKKLLPVIILGLASGTAMADKPASMTKEAVAAVAQQKCAKGDKECVTKVSEVKKAAKQAEKDAKKAEKLAAKEAKQAEKDAKKAAKQAEKEAKKEAKQAEKDAKKTAEEAKNKAAALLQ